MKIRTKLLIAFLIISLTPTLVVGIFSAIKTRHSVENQTMIFSEQLLQEVAINVGTRVEMVERLSDEMMINPAVQRGLNHFAEIDILEKGQLIRQIEDMVTNSHQILRYVTDVEIITLNREYLYGFGYKKVSDDDITNLINICEETDGEIGWETITFHHAPNIVVFRELFSEETKESVGYLVMTFRQELLVDMYRAVDFGQESEIVIFNGQGRIISSKKDLTQKTKESLYSNSDHIVEAVLKEHSMKIVATIPREIFTRDSIEIIQKILLVLGGCIVVSLVFSLYISNIIYSPIKKLVKNMKEVEEGNFDTEIEINSKDEIGYFAVHFNNMILEIKGLIERVKKEQDEKRMKEIQMLQAQINPHFLFNTLNSLKWTAKISQANSVSKGLGALALILRNTIVDKNPMITIEEEIKNIRNYEIIQKIRYGDTFDIEINCEDNFKEQPILKFLLQPIVENAIIHGQNSIEYNMVIKVDFKEDEKCTYIIIEDNGSGFELESNGRISGIGMHNVSERIRLNYGINYGMEVYSKVGEGTTVRLTIPKTK